jgi:hypothetical protein
MLLTMTTFNGTCCSPCQKGAPHHLSKLARAGAAGVGTLWQRHGVSMEFPYVYSKRTRALTFENFCKVAVKIMDLRRMRMLNKQNIDKVRKK